MTHAVDAEARGVGHRSSRSSRATPITWPRAQSDTSGPADEPRCARPGPPAEPGPQGRMQQREPEGKTHAGKLRSRTGRALRLRRGLRARRRSPTLPAWPAIAVLATCTRRLPQSHGGGDVKAARPSPGANRCQPGATRARGRQGTACAAPGHAAEFDGRSPLGRRAATGTVSFGFQSPSTAAQSPVASRPHRFPSERLQQAAWRVRGLWMGCRWDIVGVGIREDPEKGIRLRGS